MNSTAIQNKMVRNENEDDYAHKLTVKESMDDGFGNYSNGYRLYHSEDDETETLAIPPSNTTLEESLSKSLLKLSITDRNAVEEEIHGVRCMGVTKETPDLLQGSLLEFNRELLTIKNSPSRIKELQRRNRYSTNNSSSRRQSSDPIDVLKNIIDTQDTTTATSSTTAASTTSRQQCYVNDPNVRLRFLRCENFNAKEAAKRFVNFLNLAGEVFGDFVADRPIRLSDFLEAPGGGMLRRYQQHEKKALSNSKVQFLPFRDRSGRRVKVGVGDCNSKLALFLRIKINLLLDWIASEDVETQQKGVVIIVWPSDVPTAGNNNNNVSGASSGVSSGSESDDERHWEGRQYSQNAVAFHKRYYHAQPLRVAAMHWCSQDRPYMRILNSLYYFSLDSKSQKRYKVHFGEPLEIRYELQAYGIPVDLLPLTHTMALKRQNHSQWIACRKYIEEKQQQQQYQQQQQQFRQPFLQHTLDDERAQQFFESVSGSPSQGGAPASNGCQPVVVECPRSYDVIIGKAKVCANNPGNGFYSSLIEATHDRHDSLVHARDKVAMTWRILLHITEERKGRFLDWNKSLNSWVVIQDRIVIRKKIANSYKEYKRSRYVTARNSNGSHKKKQAPIETGSSETKTNENHNTSSVTSKRRKINGCLGNEICNTGGSQTESMFAAL